MYILRVTIVLMVMIKIIIPGLMSLKTQIMGIGWDWGLREKLGRVVIPIVALAVVPKRVDIHLHHQKTLRIIMSVMMIDWVWKWSIMNVQIHHQKTHCKHWIRQSLGVMRRNQTNNKLYRYRQLKKMMYLNYFQT